MCGDCIGFHDKDKAKEKHHVMASFKDKDPETLQQAARQLSPVLCFGEIGFMGLPELEDTSGKFMLPWGVAVNEEDEIAVTDSGHNRVQVFRSDGSHLITFGSRSGLKCDRNGEFDYPTGIVFDKKGHIIVADSCNHRVQIFSGRGDYLSQFGKEGSLDHELMKPYGLSLDSDGNIIVADTGNKLIKFFTPSGEFIRKIGGDGILDNAHYCVQQGKHFIVSDIDHCIKIFDLKGNYLYKFGKQGEGDGDFKSPRGLLVTQAGQLAVCDSENHRVQVFEQNGKFFTKFGKNGSEIGDLYYPTSLAALSDGKIVIADMYNNRIQIFK